MHDRRTPSRTERRIALSFALALLPALAGCNLYDSAVYGNRRNVTESPGSGAPAGNAVPAPAGTVQSEALPPPPGAGSEAPASAAGSLPSPSAAGSSPSGTQPGFGNQVPAGGGGPAPVPLPRGGGGTQVASAEAPAAAKPRFDWPVRGKVISGYGQKPGGRRNDGIDIAAPSGAPVKAAEAGTVVYAGNEVKGLGNLVLVSHDGGFVTAYAQTEQMLVKKGDKVRRGQTIATVGQTGGATEPQLHFEIRVANKPVDPMGYLSK